MSAITYAESATPSTPSTGKAKTFVPVSSVPTLAILDDAGVVGKIAISGAFTLTVPATGTAALISSGTWTPTIAGTATAGSHTYTRQIGRYTKIGTLVYVIFYVTINAKDGTMAGNVQIAGLPFTTKNASNVLQAGSIASWGSLATAMVNVSIYTNTNATTAPMLKATAATASLAAMVAADIQNGSEFVGSIVYEADA